MNEAPAFSGFSDPSENWSKLPHQLIESLPIIKSAAELKVVLYVLRHTWGYREWHGEFKRISLDEFEHGRKRKDGTRMDGGVGMNREAIADGLRRAQEHGFIVCEVDDRDRGRIKKSYALRTYNTSPSGNSTQSENPTPDDGKSDSRTGESDSVHGKKPHERYSYKDHSAKTSHYDSPSVSPEEEEEPLSEQKSDSGNQQKFDYARRKTADSADRNTSYDPLTELESLILSKIAPQKTRLNKPQRAILRAEKFIAGQIYPSPEIYWQENGLYRAWARRQLDWLAGQDDAADLLRACRMLAKYDAPKYGFFDYQVGQPPADTDGTGYEPARGPFEGEGVF